MTGGHFIIVLEQEQIERFKELAERGHYHDAFVGLLKALSGPKRLYQEPGRKSIQSHHVCQQGPKKG